MIMIMEYHYGKKPTPAQSKEICQHVSGGTRDKYETHVTIDTRR